MIQVKNILVPTDFSDTSLPSLRYAVELARKFGAKVHLLYVIEDPVEVLPIFGGYTPDRATLEEFAKSGLAAWRDSQDLSGVPVADRFVHGRPYLEIVRDARQNDIDLIVMGTHGRGFTGHLLMGSVAEQVVRHSPCPVLTVRPSDFRYVSDVHGL